MVDILHVLVTYSGALDLCVTYGAEPDRASCGGRHHRDDRISSMGLVSLSVMVVICR